MLRKKTEEKVNELAEAQKRTEHEIQKLVGEHQKNKGNS